MQLYNDLPSHSDPARQENNYNRHLNDHRIVRNLCFASAYLQYRLYTEPNRRAAVSKIFAFSLEINLRGFSLSLHMGRWGNM